jgi:hypothetical protein
LGGGCRNNYRSFGCFDHSLPTRPQEILRTKPQVIAAENQGNPDEKY